MRTTVQIAFGRRRKYQSGFSRKRQRESEDSPGRRSDNLARISLNWLTVDHRLLVRLKKIGHILMRSKDVSGADQHSADGITEIADDD
jgi:hypothetical protein